MKKTLLISISLVVCSLLFAATYSTTAKNSFDLYHNTLDKAFYPNEEFTSLDKTYLFMSGEDLEFNLTDSSSGTFVGGVYTKIADRPYSLFIKSSVENNYGYGGKSYEETPVQGLTNTVTETLYPNFSSFDHDLSFATAINKNSIVGLNVRLYRDLSGYDAEDAYKEKTTIVNTYVGSDESPELSGKSTGEEHYKFPISFSISAPFCLITNASTITAQAGIALENNSISGSYSSSNDSGSSSKEEKVDAINKNIMLFADYTQNINSPFFKDSSKSFSFGGSIVGTILKQSHTMDSEDKNEDGVTLHNEKQTYKNGLNFGIALRADQKLTYKIADSAELVLKPAISLSFASSSDPSLNDYEYESKRYDKDFNFLNSSYHKTISVNNVAGINLNSESISPASKGNILCAEFKIASAIKLQKPASKLSVILGCQGEASFSRTTEETKIATAEMKETITNGEDSTSETETINSGYYSKHSSVNVDFSIQTAFSVNYDFSDSFQLVCSFGNRNLFEVGNVTVQAVIGL